MSLRIKCQIDLFPQRTVKKVEVFKVGSLEDMYKIQINI